ncbi:Phosphate acetyltransferase [Hyphomicrobiales bacterium]|nr:Phosphate acetyltransferase [Hyphomicrobiales bacterium]CAH1697307.1 Phosphate acetyltransferase [Hyphomicrobiales bacterium]CAI0345493.1 Phosphate acetyltransferase [Hyphomicrobiales bacterium]
MKPLDHLITAARANPRRIALSDGTDPRVIAAALRAMRDGLGEITLVGDEERIAAALVEQQCGCERPHIEDPARSSRTAAYIEAYAELRRAKGMTPDQAAVAMQDPLTFAAMMVREGAADGTVGGAARTTGETVRTALQIIGRAPGQALVSSFFLMLLCEPHHAKKGILVFADCGLVIEPDATELAEIAVASARSYESLTREAAKVALLSFSTAGSASHQRVAKVVEATRLARLAAPQIALEGELQFDAAFVESIGRAKAPNSSLNGAANVFVFPNLDAANIGYKIAQRIGGAIAIGPILQGLVNPANDLSRGCSADDVYHLIATTIVQAR